MLDARDHLTLRWYLLINLMIFQILIVRLRNILSRMMLNYLTCLLDLLPALCYAWLNVLESL